MIAAQAVETINNPTCKRYLPEKDTLENTSSMPSLGNHSRSKASLQTPTGTPGTCTVKKQASADRMPSRITEGAICMG
jgi:hypothetical protein